MIKHPSITKSEVTNSEGLHEGSLSHPVPPDAVSRDGDAGGTCMACPGYGQCKQNDSLFSGKMVKLKTTYYE